MCFNKNNRLLSLITINQRLLHFLTWLVISTNTCISYADDTILVNRPSSETDSRYQYPNTLLKHILEETEVQYGKAKIQPAKLVMARNRTLIELEKGINIHVMAEAPKPGWEERLIPVRIPIRKGIQGFRTFLILAKNQARLSKITSLEQLKEIRTGSGQQWSTTRVLKENGFNVQEGRNYEGLFRMLMNDRFITFGRGINETTAEYLSHKQKYPELAIEQDLLLYIPLPTYFFVTPTRPKLAQRIEIGLLTMINNGKFEKIFKQEFSEVIKESRLSQRRIFKINNPNLSKLTPLQIKDYWYQP